MIPTDFDVVRIGSCETLTLFGAERKSLFHFVRYEAGSGVSQYHVPHYPVAYAISRNEQAHLYKLPNGFELMTRGNGQLAVVICGACWLLDGSVGSMADRMFRAAEILNTSRKRVVSESGLYTVAGAKTQGGNPVSSKSRLLTEGIAFERSLLHRLSAKEFGLYSAFCTHRDFPCALDKKSCLKEMLENDFEFYEANPPSGDVLRVVMTVQDSFVGCRIWEPGAHMPIKQAVEALAGALSKLHPVQRTQMVLLNGMHGGNALLHLALLTGMVAFDSYTQFRTAEYQPDSEDEQWIRSTASYIQLFGDLGRAES
jgi:hypothetical protein